MVVVLLTACIELSSLWADEVTAPRLAEAEIEVAKTVAKKVERDEATWQELALQMAKAVEAYNPASVHTMPEGESLEAFRKYCQKLLESGKSFVALHEKWNKASVGLEDSLRKAPAYYRSASEAMKQKAEKVRFAEIKRRYLLAADIWGQLALKAERRSKDLGLDQGSKGVIDLIIEENDWLSDFLKTLDAVPRVSGDAGGGYRELIQELQSHARKSDELYRQLKLFRDKLKAGV
jgi:hypothetical protein